jgi:hypothetical protein
MLASYSEWMGIMDIFRSTPARLILALLIAFIAFSEFMAPIMALAYREHDFGLLNFLGARTPGDDYRRFVPVIEAVPLWLLCIWVTSGLLYLASAGELLRKSRTDLVLFVLAFGMGLLGNLSQHLVPSLIRANEVAFTFPLPNFRRDVLVPLGARVLLPAFIAISLWWMARPRSPLPSGR